MSSHLVDGVPLPDAVGGHPALDFCNTRAGWGSPSPKEYLVSARALRLWAVDAGLLTRRGPTGPGEPADPAEADRAEGEALARALAFREDLYRCLTGTGEAVNWNSISQEIAEARAAAVLRPGDDGAARWVPRDAAAGTDTRALHALRAAAGAAEDLLRSPLVGAVTACPGDGCGWLFADPRRRRRWCSMAVCGNRAKARRFAARHHGQ